MSIRRVVPSVVLTIVAGGSLRAQAVLRPAPSGRATTEVSLSYPRPAATTVMTGMAGMAGMAPATPAAGAPAAGAPAAATPAPKPLVIRLDYGQPHLRGRTLHVDSLVPYDRAWRTGASASTTLTTEVDLTLGGASVVKGTYVIYSLPARTGWKLILQRSVGQSAMQYADSNDVVRIDLRHTTLAAPVESFTMWLIPSLEPGAAHGELRFAWGTDQLSTDWVVKGQ
ncbi:MAG: DUF2911 domain-containing protein [Gemmatimonadota bacterium]|nr:DUF2911 domain-containing protein [Gemmatimonadota bacterium]